MMAAEIITVFYGGPSNPPEWWQQWMRTNATHHEVTSATAAAFNAAIDPDADYAGAEDRLRDAMAVSTSRDAAFAAYKTADMAADERLQAARTASRNALAQTSVANAQAAISAWQLWLEAEAEAEAAVELLETITTTEGGER